VAEAIGQSDNFEMAWRATMDYDDENEIPRVIAFDALAILILINNNVILSSAVPFNCDSL